ncbi:hypothetical protein PG994_001909 [Apiospora phragmitis]|uniref:DUF7704 domain-containing protein n=1 Tax=Apiospora phragmitis TaxID=2905665 RepID=A0ABR1WUS2_9PEZI
MSPIPLTYRIIFNYAEPLMATLGAVQAVVAPRDLLRLSLPSVPYTTAMYPLFSQMCGAWLMFAFHDVVTLRIYQHVHIWKHILGAAILSDLGYVASLVQSMGLAWFCSPLRWDGANAFTVVSTLLPLLAKIFFVLGVGLPRSTPKAKVPGKEL